MSEQPINVTDGAFERAVLQADRPVVAAFWSRESDRAAQLRAVTEAAACTYAGEVRVARLEEEDVPQARTRYKVDTLPQFLFFRDGKLLARARGLPTEETLRPWVEYLLGRGPQPSTGTGKGSPESATRSIAVSDADFARVVLGANLPTLVDFWAAWCGPCRMVGPIVERLAAEFARRALVAKLDVDANPRTAEQFGVMSIPTLILFKDGQEIDRLVGAQPEEVLRSRLAAIL